MLGSNRTTTLSREAVDALVAERATFRRFLARRVGNETDADDLLQQSLLRALQRGGGLRQGERAVPWFYRILRNAVADHFRHRAVAGRISEQFRHEEPDIPTNLAPDWESAVCACFEGLLPGLNARYAEVIERIDLRGELKVVVASDLKVSVATLNVRLHRARRALRRRLEVFCGACSREHCLACACERTPRPVDKGKV